MQRRIWLLGAVLVIALIVVVGRRPASTGANGGVGAGESGAAQGSRRGEAVGDIRLDLLEHRSAGRPAPTRDLFRFRARRDPSQTAAPSRPAPVRPPPPSAPPGPPPPPPIPLRFIGFVEQAGEASRVAVLSDGRGNVFNGREGDIIEGRYRVLRVGVDSADLIYVDGRGRQTIRLSGQ